MSASSDDYKRVTSSLDCLQRVLGVLADELLFLFADGRFRIISAAANPQRIAASARLEGRNTSIVIQLIGPDDDYRVDVGWNFIIEARAIHPYVNYGIISLPKLLGEPQPKSCTFPEPESIAALKAYIARFDDEAGGDGPIARQP